jgi:hypothetical protein
MARFKNRGASKLGSRAESAQAEEPDQQHYDGQHHPIVWTEVLRVAQEFIM